MTHSQIISARILALVNAGTPIEDAIDQVLGAGTFAKVADTAYTLLRAKLGAA